MWNVIAVPESQVTKIFRIYCWKDW